MGATVPEFPIVGETLAPSCILADKTYRPFVSSDVAPACEEVTPLHILPTRYRGASYAGCPIGASRSPPRPAREDRRRAPRRMDPCTTCSSPGRPGRLAGTWARGRYLQDTGGLMIGGGCSRPTWEPPPLKDAAGWGLPDWRTPRGGNTRPGAGATWRRSAQLYGWRNVRAVSDHRVCHLPLCRFGGGWRAYPVPGVAAMRTRSRLGLCS